MMRLRMAVRSRVLRAMEASLESDGVNGNRKGKSWLEF